MSVGDRTTASTSPAGAAVVFGTDTFLAESQIAKSLAVAAATAEVIGATQAAGSHSAGVNTHTRINQRHSETRWHIGS